MILLINSKPRTVIKKESMSFQKLTNLWSIQTLNSFVFISYFPIQKELKIRPNKSSELNVPVISAKLF